MTSGVSNEYRKEEREIRYEPIIKINDWRMAALWANDRSRMELRVGDEYFVRSSKAIDKNWTLSEESIALIKNTKYRSFDQYVDLAFGFYWQISISHQNWQTESSCNCPYFLKNFMCKHVIGLSLRMKICKLPRAAIATPLGAKPKSGRKANAKKALLTQ